MSTSPTGTRERLQRCALALFEERGYVETPVTAIAREAGVSHMTFFRHFPSKADVVVSDLFDPVIAAAVASQPAPSPALERAVRGLVSAMEHEAAREEMRSPQFRQRLGLITSTPELRSALWTSGQLSQQAIAEALTTSGTSAVAARTAAGAVMGAATAVLLHWGAEPDGSFADDALRDSLLSLLEDAP